MASSGPSSDESDAECSSWWSQEDEENADPIDLHTAASLGELTYIEGLLLRESVQINKINNGGWTPLMYASYIGHTRVVKELIHSGGDVHIKTKFGRCSLSLAASCGNDDVCELLLTAGAKVNSIDNSGWTPLLHATASGHENVVVCLLKHNANINQRDLQHGMTPLCLAAAEGHEMIVQRILEKNNVLTNCRSRDGLTARELATLYGFVAIANLIMAHDLRQQMSRLNSVSERRCSEPSIQDGPSAVNKIITIKKVATPITDDDLKDSFSSDGTNSTSSEVDSSVVPSDISQLLQQLGLTRYLPLFEREEVDLAVLLTFTERDLQELGMEKFGPRRKLSTAISRLVHQRSDHLLPYADRLKVQLDELAELHSAKVEHLAAVERELEVERQLRQVAETCAVERRASQEYKKDPVKS